MQSRDLVAQRKGSEDQLRQAEFEFLALRSAALTTACEMNEAKAFSASDNVSRLALALPKKSDGPVRLGQGQLYCKLFIGL